MRRGLATMRRPASRADGTLDDLAAKRAILDDYARHCANVDNPAREMICGVTRTVIRHLATAYADHPDYDPAWRP
ncbi:DUF6221 family protein [Amycolatopsis sp. NPDC051758]|uniref:DUF6221 family protein n=1 Tax=Amycolatopsis sp. NPDC051758 TaxID=3363935 RepID=UPI0037AD1FD7